ncbi:MAG TPA: dihydrofolate reductase family protein [Thermomicrobiales bacterium]|nr:dihydrofolate reductase family protein [Thermomicrobiales bacterium]
MRKLVVSEFVSLDGVFEEPAWTFAFLSDEQEAFKFAELKAADALLLGRVTYEGFAAAWPGMAEQTGEYGAMMNGYPKYVASTTLTTPTWNASVLRGDLATAVAALKDQPGRDLLVFGSGQLVAGLMAHGLVDEYRLLVFPVVLGRGRRLFPEGAEATLRLVEARPFGSGVVALTYRPAAAPAAAGPA